MGRVTPLMTVDHIHVAFLNLMGGLYEAFEDLGIGSLEYVLFRTPCVYFDDERQYFILGDIEESSDDSSSSSDDSWSEDDEDYYVCACTPSPPPRS
ncbi:hypothetical protein ABEB36_013991 [Hypothenemus hampei]|uniref:Uncharacterized protein n=1 Tax=Hypothenemus hampei TaxID=57062 RepID=A0ABD1E3U0_HYPHA